MPTLPIEIDSYPCVSNKLQLVFPIAASKCQFLHSQTKTPGLASLESPQLARHDLAELGNLGNSDSLRLSKLLVEEGSQTSDRSTLSAYLLSSIHKRREYPCN